MIGKDPESSHSVKTDIEDLKKKIHDLGSKEVACVISTTRLAMIRPLLAYT